MGYLLPIIFGSISGAAGGFVLIYLFGGFINSPFWQIIGGLIVGAIFGGLIGSVSGDANASGDLGRHRVLIAGIFGAGGGYLGATKLAILWAFFRYMHWPTPMGY